MCVLESFQNYDLKFLFPSFNILSYHNIVELALLPLILLGIRSERMPRVVHIMTRDSAASTCFVYFTCFMGSGLSER